ncbi:MAG: 2OG-Fe(II) oxygenase [Pseudomonadota bacterium]
MSQPFYSLDPETLNVDTKTAKSLGVSKAQAYQSGEPFHHICIDDFLPMAVIERVRTDINSLPEAELSLDMAQEKLKSNYNPDRLPEYTRHVFQALNARPFVLFLEEMTGIKGLIPDPYYIGGGIHKTLNGGYLNIHADFNVHTHMRVERRLNVLIYLNPPWKEEWGGSFEVWDNDMKHKMASFTPTENRMVCFSTSSTSWHGNPEPVNHPDGLPRLSMALYYYTATWDDTRPEHSTLFRPRPGTEDTSIAAFKRRQFVKDVLPPALYRRVARPLRSIGL